MPVMDVFLIAKASSEHLRPSRVQAKTLNQLIAASYLLTAAITVTTTFMIAYRVHSFSQKGPINSSASSLKRVIEIVTQSAVLYTLTAPLNAVLALFPDSESAVLEAARDYTYDFFLFSAGFAPTIMVARVAHNAHMAEISSTSGRLSTLEFQNNSSNYKSSSGPAYQTAHVSFPPQREIL
ncbi:hypothetical protein CVT26_014804 [Gymnopilus dilepis]|uniref:Uncharacterized protein n=1 Tax=Gymnopilus dilepis TaxID=231916 RepID=A0A409W3W2_9AGAR|nr:hypothetical protein CVT26_014804 [Gymnopilus dilepis]